MRFFRNIHIYSIFLSVLFFPLYASAAWTLIANTSAASTGGSPNTTTTSGIDTTGADLIVVFVGSYVPGTFPTLSDSKGNIWTQLGTSAETYSEGTFFYTIPTSVGSSHTFTAAGATSYPNIIVTAWKGVNKSDPFDKENGASTSASNTLSTGSVTPSENNELVIAGVEYGEAGSVTNNLGFTEVVDTTWSSGNNFHHALIYEIQGAATVRNPQWTSTGGGSGNSTGATRIATFRSRQANLKRPTNNLLGLVGWWTFDGNTMTSNVGDSSGQGNNGHLVTVTATTTVIGKLSQAFRSIGTTNAGIDVPHSSSIAVAGPNITIANWVYLDATPTAEVDWFGKWNLSGSVRSYFQGSHYASSFARILCGVSSDGGTTNWHLQRSVSAHLTAGWQHVVCTYNGTSWTMYYNGVSVAVENDLGSAQSSIYSGGSEPLHIGYLPTTAFTGALDDVRLYNRSLSSSEVSVLYNSGQSKIAKTATVVSGNLLGHWTFDGSKLTSNVADSSGNNRNGYISGQTSTTTIIGKIGQAIDLDGSNDVVIIPDETALDPRSGAWTMSLWAKPANANQTSGLLAKRENSGSFNQLALFVGSSDGSCNITSSKKIGFVQYDSTGKCQYTTNDVVDGEWHHIVAVRNSDGDLSAIYIDGVSMAITTSVTFGDGIADVNNAENWRIGELNNGTSYMDGPIDDVRIYNRALTSTEVNLLYRLGQIKIRQ